MALIFAFLLCGFVGLIGLIWDLTVASIILLCIVIFLLAIMIA